METLTHIRQLQDNNYLGSWDLPLENEGKKIVTISKVENSEVIGSGNKKSLKAIVYFKEFKKGLVLNATNRKSIQTALQSPYIEHWIGKKIMLYRTNLKAFGEYVDSIRVENKQPEIILPILTKDHKKWQGIINSIKDGSQNVESIKQYFQISEEIKIQIEHETKCE